MSPSRHTAIKTGAIIIGLGLGAVLVLGMLRFPMGEAAGEDGTVLSWAAADYAQPVSVALGDVKGTRLGFTQVGITSHHLPVAATFIADFYRTLADSEGPRQTFVVVGPDHFERCRSHVSTTSVPYGTAFGTLEPDLEIIRELVDAGAGEGDSCFEREHSIGAQVPFIASLFPDAHIVPITLSAATDDATLERIADVLSRFQERITVVASVDFAHYRSADDGRRMDDQSEALITGMDVSAVSQDFLDSPPSIKLAVLLAKWFSQTRSHVLGRANSADFTGDTRNTTGYRNVLFLRP